MPDRSVKLALLHRLEQTGYTGSVALTAHNDHDAERLEAAGVDVVLRPFHAAADSGAAIFFDEARTRRATKTPGPGDVPAQRLCRAGRPTATGSLPAPNRAGGGGVRFG